MVWRLTTPLYAGETSEAAGDPELSASPARDRDDTPADLEIATDITYTELTVSDTVRDRVRQSTCNSGVEAGTIDIRILAIENRPTQE